MVKTISKKTGHNESFVREIVSRFCECTRHCYPGVNVNEIEVIKFSEMIEKLQDQTQLCDRILKELIEEARKIDYYPGVVSITGIGENLAARIIAELGDMSRFKNRRAISAYAGLNPKIQQSGETDGTHLRISKKGNRRLRCLLYLGAACNYRLKRHDELYEFNQKKRQQSITPLKTKAANIATAHKLLIIIFSLCRTGEKYRS